jgi:hypothetical protein
MVRFVLILAAVMLLAPFEGAAAQNAALAVVQQIHDQAYAKCMQDARFGAGTALQSNCSCSADVVVDLLSDELKAAIAEGRQASFKGPKLKGDEKSFNATLAQTCPGMAPYLQ